MYKQVLSGLVELSAGAWAAQVLPAFGMNTVALSFHGIPILRTPLSLQALEQYPYAYGTPVLLPPNRTDGGRFTFDGTSYQLPVNDPENQSNLHGVLHRQPFDVLDRTQRTVRAVYENQGGGYPFPFSMEVLCVLERWGYRQIFTVKNTGSCDMPLTFGIHTTFLERSRFRVDIGKRQTLDERFLPTGGAEPLRGVELAYLRGARFQGQKIHGSYTASGHTAQIGDILYTVSENFDHWVLWNGDGHQGFCTIEPLQGGVNALNSGEGLIRLKPDESTVFETSFRYAGSEKDGRPCGLYLNDGLHPNGAPPVDREKYYRRCPPPERSWTYL